MIRPALRGAHGFLVVAAVVMGASAACGGSGSNALAPGDDASTGDETGGDGAVGDGSGGGDGAADAASDAPTTAVIPPTTASRTGGSVRVVVANDLGMHCYDADYSVMSILPPFNNVHAQVIDPAKRKLLSDADVTLRYSAVADTAGLYATTSVGKSNFWTYSSKLFGATPDPDTGLLGQRMPGPSNEPQSFKTYEAAYQWFVAAGIPVTSTSDSGAKNYYPMFRVEAVSKASGAVLGYTDVVTPVSDEMHCGTCHDTGKAAAKDPAATWSADPNEALQYRNNILTLHDLRHATKLAQQKPVLCASCHYSPALDLAGTGPTPAQAGHTLLSHAVHGRHGRDAANATTGAPIVPDTRDGCYNCHPGAETKCLRGTMGKASISCQNCHGGMLAVASAFPRTAGGKRTPWLEEPKCQSCHTGDAASHATVSGIMATDGIRMVSAFTPGDRAAEPRTAPTSRFAENASLYRFSRGHGGVFCEGCHNSTHAEWPSTSANDGITATQVQGHAGVVIECDSCHTSLALSATGGPHGLHSIGAQWARDHGDYAKNPAPCQACHGVDYRGSALSKTHAARSFTGGGLSKTYAEGTPVSCYDCHNGPKGP